MPSYMRLTQHKPKREKAIEGKTQLHKEVEKLKRQVSRLKKELSKRGGIEEEAIEQAMTEEAQTEPPPVSEGPKCPECSGEMRNVDLGGRTYAICVVCKYRKKAA